MYLPPCPIFSGQCIREYFHTKKSVMYAYKWHGAMLRSIWALHQDVVPNPPPPLNPLALTRRWLLLKIVLHVD